MSSDVLRVLTALELQTLKCPENEVPSGVKHVGQKRALWEALGEGPSFIIATKLL